MGASFRWGPTVISWTNGLRSRRGGARITAVDPARSARFLREKLLPSTRYYTYLELAAPDSQDHSSTLWAEYERVAEASTNFAMRHATKREEIYPVFRELFKKESQ